MVSADQFLQCDVRLRQAKLKPNARFGDLAMNICGDFLQLPPVDKHGTRKSLAAHVDELGGVEVDEEPLEMTLDLGEQVKDGKRREQMNLETRQGLELWRSIKIV